MSNLNEQAKKAAASYLRHRGYTVLEEGWTCPAGEIDIVAEDEGTLVFANVKARRDADKGFPAERNGATSRTKREMVALAYLAGHDFTDMPVRFDNVSLVTVGADRALLRHHIGCLSAEADLSIPESLPEAA